MSAPLGSHRQLAAEVRGLALTKVKAILELSEDKMTRPQKELQDALLLKLTPTLLPRLNELTGEDGKDLFPIPILNAFSTDNGDQKNKPASQADSSGAGGNVSQ